MPKAKSPSRRDVSVDYYPSCTTCSMVYRGEFYKMKYVLWEGTKAEMIADFLEYVKAEDDKIIRAM